jgi:hypothetical protein
MKPDLHSLTKCPRVATVASAFHWTAGYEGKDSGDNSNQLSKTRWRKRESGRGKRASEEGLREREKGRKKERENESGREKEL